MKKKARLTKAERQNYNLSNYLGEALIGLILGDAHMRRYSSNGNARVVFGQGENNSEYIKHIYELFKDFVSQELSYVRVGKEGGKGNKPRIQIKFATLSLPCFNYYYELFYH